jgi:hypothetical protein
MSKAKSSVPPQTYSTVIPQAEIVQVMFIVEDHPVFGAELMGQF